MKSYLILITMMISINIVAQNFNLPVTDTALVGHPSDDDFGAQIALENTLGSNVSMKWVKILDSLTVGWESTVCDPTNCHPPGVDSSTFTLGNAPGSIMNVHFLPHDIEGQGKVQFRVYETGKEDSAVIVTYYGSAYLPVDSTTSISEKEFKNVDNIKFNQLNSTITVDRKIKNSNISVYNLSGIKLISAFNKQQFSIEELPKGVYIVQLTSERFKSRLTKKIIKL